MNEEQLLKNLKTYANNYKNGIHELLDEATATALADAMEHENSIVNPQLREVVSTLNRIPRDDFSKVEKLPKPTIAVISSLTYYESINEEKARKTNRVDEIMSSLAYPPENMSNGASKEVRPVEGKTDRCLDPFYRRGLELAAASSSVEIPDRMRAMEFSEEMNEQVLRNTLAPVRKDSAEYRQLQNTLHDENKVSEAMEQNRLQQQTIAKTLLLAHLGSMHTVQKDGRNAEYKGSAAEIFAHGGRTAFLFPKSSVGDGELTKQNLFHNYYNGIDHGTGVESRLAASHSMVPGRADSGAGSFKETGDISLRNNYQMNPAVGGLGKMFGNKPILNDGLNGQMFLQMQPGTSKKGGYLMVGFENERSMKTGRAGHFHSPVPTSAKFSSFVADKGGPGANKGGRVVDLSMYSPAMLNTFLENFNKAYSQLQLRAQNYQSAPNAGKAVNSNIPKEYDFMSNRSTLVDDFNSVNRALSGKMLSPSDLLYVSKMMGMGRTMTYTENGQQKTVDLAEMFHAKEALAAPGFDALNNKAAEKDRAERQRLGIKEYPYPSKEELMRNAYKPSQGLQTTFNDLLKAKRRFTSSDSDKMKKIKIQLGDILNRASAGTLDTETAREMYRDLAESTKSYITDTHKKQSNDRMKAVKEVDRYVRNELKRFGLDVPDPSLKPVSKGMKRSEPVMNH